MFQSIGVREWERDKKMQDTANLVYRLAQKSVATAFLLLNSIVKGLFFFTTLYFLLLLQGIASYSKRTVDFLLFLMWLHSLKMWAR